MISNTQFSKNITLANIPINLNHISLKPFTTPIFQLAMGTTTKFQSFASKSLLEESLALLWALKFNKVKKRET